MTGFLAFLLGAVRDPVTKDLSSTRLAGLLCVVGGVFVAVWGAVVKNEQAATVIGLCATAGGAFLLRSRPPTGEP